MTEEPSGERLQKVLARAGIGSRRASEELIESGRISVNGVPAHLGQRVDPSADEIAFDGVVVQAAPDAVYYLLNKPIGVLSTASDPEGRTTVLELVPSTPRVFSVGRLDLMTEGLLILTNDGSFAQALSHPSHGVEKEYLAEVTTDVSPAALRQLRLGVAIARGERTAPAKVTALDQRLLRIVVHEGRYHQVRRMCEAVGAPVSRLVRTRIGPVSDSRLAPGSYRSLSTGELRALSKAASIEPARAGK